MPDGNGGDPITRRVALLVAVVALFAACAESPSNQERRGDLGAAASASTAPLSEDGGGAAGPFNFAVIGDFGTGEQAQIRVAERMCEWRESRPFDLVVTTGDNVYPKGEASRFDETFFEPYACLLDGGVRFRATLGNHDVITDNGAPELNEPAFGMKARNYVVRKGGVRFLMVDSNTLRKRWLRRRLPAEEGDRWTVVAFHFPVFSSGPHGSTPGFRPSLHRMFRRHGVDLVLTGHDHHYEVTKKLKGIRYVVTGGGGAELYPCGKSWFTARCHKRHHFLYVRAGDERIRVTAVPPNGDPFHIFRTRGRS
jgi:hypothetical protein